MALKLERSEPPANSISLLAAEEKGKGWTVVFDLSLEQ